MKNIFLLSASLLCVASIVNNSVAADNNSSSTIATNTTASSSACSANDGSCNDTALINYSKTEADYRAYGERTKKDHLYTHSGVGNNLTATIPYDVEKDVVVASEEESLNNKPVLQNHKPVLEEADNKFSDISLNMDEDIDDGIFEDTAKNDIEVKNEDFDKGGQVVSRDDKLAQAGEPRNQVKRAESIVDGSVYEIVCEEECDEMLDDTITSEFTEESFDIADYIDETEDGDVVFTNVGEVKKTIEEVDIKEVKIADNTILTWEANEGENLRELLTKWSAMSGWKLLWNTNRNYVLSASVMFKGKFADVSSALIRAFARARPAPIATYYKGNRVIVVETMENENAY